jgi:hypothetical protein
MIETIPTIPQPLRARVAQAAIGIGIGASALDPGAGASQKRCSASNSGGSLWWTLAGVIAAFVGGYVSGRLAGKPRDSTAGWHGLTTWALTTLLVFYLLTSAVGGILGGAYRTVTGAIGGVATAWPFSACLTAFSASCWASTTRMSRLMLFLLQICWRTLPHAAERSEIR